MIRRRGRLRFAADCAFVAFIAWGVLWATLFLDALWPRVGFIPVLVVAIGLAYAQRFFGPDGERLPQFLRRGRPAQPLPAPKPPKPWRKPVTAGVGLTAVSWLVLRIGGFDLFPVGHLVAAAASFGVSFLVYGIARRRSRRRGPVE